MRKFNTGTLLSVIALLGILGLFFAQGGESDITYLETGINQKTGYPNIELKNSTTNETIAELSLTEHSDKCRYCYSKLEINHSGGVLIDAMDFYTLIELGNVTIKYPQKIRSYNLFYEGELPEYGEACEELEEVCEEINGTEYCTTPMNCSMVATGGTYPANISYNVGEEADAGSYELWILGEKKPSRKSDWVITHKGIKLSVLAVWNGISNIYDEIDDSSINATLWGVSAGVTEDTQNLSGYVSCGDTLCDQFKSANTTNLSQYISDGKNFTLSVNLYHSKGNSNQGNKAESKLYFLGTKIYDTSVGGDDDSIWTFIRNYSISNQTYSAFDDGAWLMDINYTSNKELSVDAWATGSGDSAGSNQAWFDLRYLYYRLENIVLNSPADNSISEIYNITPNATITSPDGSKIANITLYNNISGGWTANGTIELADYLLIDNQTGWTTSSSYEMIANISIDGRINKTDGRIYPIDTGGDYGMRAKTIFLYTNGSNSSDETSFVTQQPKNFTNINPNPTEKVDTIQIWLGRTTDSNAGMNYYHVHANPSTYTATWNTTINSSTSWGVLVYDTDDDYQWSLQNFTVAPDVVAISVISPSATVSSAGIVVNATLSSDSGLEYCYYNITRGASTEKANTVLNCSEFNDTLTLSGEASYVLNIWANTTNGISGEEAYAFEYSVASPPVGGGGGGGGGTTVIDSDADWTMEAGGRQGSFDVNLVKGSSQVRDVLFENIGSESRTLTLSCENQNGTSGCKYVTFKSQSITLPLIQDIKTEAEFTMTAGDDAETGLYIFNIVAKDDNGKEGRVSVFLTIKETGFFSKLSARTEGGFPYILIAIISFMVSMIISLLAMNKVKTKIKPVIAMGVSVVVVYLAVLVF